MDASTTLSVLKKATKWVSRLENHFQGNELVSLTNNFGVIEWRMYDDGEAGLYLHVYEDVEEDIKEAWNLRFTDKPLPLAACDGDSYPEKWVLLLQAESSFTLRLY